MTPLEVERNLRVIVALELREAVEEFDGREHTMWPDISRLREAMVRAADQLFPRVEPTERGNRRLRAVISGQHSVRVDQ